MDFLSIGIGFVLGVAVSAVAVWAWGRWLGEHLGGGL